MMLGFDMSPGDRTGRSGQRDWLLKLISRVYDLCTGHCTLINSAQTICNI